MAKVFAEAVNSHGARIHGFLHYLAHVEQAPDAVNRLLAFIAEHEPDHDSLVHYKPSE